MADEHVIDVDGGAIQYIDMGDYTLEIDNRGPVQQRRQHPKALTSVGVTPQVRQELEYRIENEVKPLVEVRREAAAQVDGSSLAMADGLPPVEDWEAVGRREQAAAEAVQEANKQSGETRDEQQAAVADNLAEPTWGSDSQRGEAWSPPWEEPSEDPNDPSVGRSSTDPAQWNPPSEEAQGATQAEGDPGLADVDRPPPSDEPQTGEPLVTENQTGEQGDQTPPPSSGETGTTGEGVETPPPPEGQQG